MRSRTFDDIASQVAALPIDAKIASMWKLMRQLSRSSLSGAHAVVFLAVYGRVRTSCAVPTIDLGELASEVGVSGGAAVSDLIADLENIDLVMIDGGRGATVRATIPALLADRSRIVCKSSAPAARVLH
jgi:hypothetical protein